MRAAGAKSGRALRHRLIKAYEFGKLHAESRANAVLTQLAAGTEDILASVNANSVCAKMSLDNAVKLLDNDELFDPCGKVCNELYGQGVDHAEL